MQKHIHILLLLTLAYSANYIKQSCTSTQIFDTTTLACVSCPTNMRPNPKQSIPTSCICNKGYYPLTETTCAYLGSSATVCSFH